MMMQGFGTAIDSAFRQLVDISGGRAIVIDGIQADLTEDHRSVVIIIEIGERTIVAGFDFSHEVDDEEFVDISRQIVDSFLVALNLAWSLLPPLPSRSIH